MESSDAPLDMPESASKQISKRDRPMQYMALFNEWATPFGLSPGAPVTSCFYDSPRQTSSQNLHQNASFIIEKSVIAVPEMFVDGAYIERANFINNLPKTKV